MVPIGVLACALCTYADTHWVNPAGSNEPPYTTYATGAHNIQDAIDAASGGDTVRVAAGSYDLDTTVIVWDSLAFIGAGMDSTFFFWNGPEGLIMVHTYGYTYITGFDLNGNDVEYVRGVNLYSAKQPVEIAKCRIHDCEWELSAYWSILDMHDCEVTSEHFGVRLSPYQLKSIHHNTFYGWAKAIYCWSECEIFNNVFHVLYDYSAVSLVDNPDEMLVHNNLFLECGESIFVRNSDQAYICNNTIIGTTNEQFGPMDAAFNDPGQAISIINNIFLDCEGAITMAGAEQSPAICHFHYNCIWPPRDPLFVIYDLVDIDSSGVIFADPMLSSDSNFYLQAGSPCINSGDPTILDVDGSRSDMGMHGGPGGITYFYPEEAPARPDTLIGQPSGDTVELAWSPSSESDLAEYRLYRDTYSGFTPHAGNLLAAVNPEDTTYVDSIEGLEWDLYYVLTVINTAGLESSPSNEVAVLGTGILEEEEPTDPLPRTPYIVGNYPNPFNASTIIEYYIPDVGARPTLVQLVIYDAMGRKASALVNRKLYPGKHRVSWDGRTDSGDVVASGVYFARLNVWGYEFKSSVKLVMQK